jgi:hypothetical protein
MFSPIPLLHLIIFNGKGQMPTKSPFLSIKMRFLLKTRGDNGSGYIPALHLFCSHISCQIQPNNSD